MSKYNQARSLVFGVYTTIAVLCLFSVFVVILTVIVRTAGFDAANHVLFRWLPAGLAAIYRDPLLILALLIAGLFVWSCPLFYDRSHANGSASKYPFRRGRYLSGSGDKRLQQHYQALDSRRRKRGRGMPYGIRGGPSTRRH